jgi:hypothetical protein
MKIRLAIALLLIIVGLIAIPLQAIVTARQAAPTLNGAWNGTFETSAFTLAMELALADTGSQWSGNVKFSQDARIETPAVRDLKVQNQQISFGVLLAGMELKFAGTLANEALSGTAEGFRDGAKIGAGKWQLRRNSAPVISTTKTAAPSAGQSSSDDAEAIKHVIQRYLNVTDKKEQAAIAQAFHPDTKLLSVGRNGLNQMSLDEWWGRVSRIPGQVTRKSQVTVLEVSGLAAIVKVDFGTSKDFISLLKVGGEWKIVSKILSTSLN